MRGFLVLLFLSFSLSAKSNTEELITRCDSLMSAKDYKSVVSETRSFLKKNGKSAEAEDVVPFLMEAEVLLKEYGKFKKLHKNFQKRFPDSPKLARSFYLAGIVEAQNESYVDAAISFSVSEAHATTPKEKALVKKNIDMIGSNHLTIPELSELVNEQLAPIVREAMAYYYAIKMKNSDTIKAQSLVAAFKATYPTSKYDTDKTVQTKREDQATEKFKTRTVAIMAPLTGNSKRLGKEALNAFSLVLAQHEANTGEKITLVVVDTKGSPVVTALKTAELIDRKVSAIVGPIMSNTATVAAAMLMDHPEIVMVTPTATDDGIGSLGKNIFQLNLTTKALAEKIARYSVEGLGIKEYAVLAPISDYGRAMTDYFSAAVLNLGGEIIFSEYFTPSAHDHRAQFDALREAYADRKFGSIDSTYTLTQSEKKKRAAFIEDSTIAVGGLFIPAMSANAVKLAAEVPFYKIQTQLLGSNGWKNNVLILDGGKYVTGAVLSSGYAVSKSSTSWKTFATEFKTNYGSEPGKMVAPLVYDAGSLLIKALQNSANGEEISRKLWVTAGYQGLSGEISLDNESGVNSGAIIMKVSGGKFLRLQ